MGYFRHSGGARAAVPRAGHQRVDRKAGDRIMTSQAQRIRSANAWRFRNRPDEPETRKIRRDLAALRLRSAIRAAAPELDRLDSGQLAALVRTPELMKAVSEQMHEIAQHVAGTGVWADDLAVTFRSRHEEDLDRLDRAGGEQWDVGRNRDYR